jgi:hypothetical protein
MRILRTAAAICLGAASVLGCSATHRAEGVSSTTGPLREVDESGAADAALPTITFSASWTDEASQPLVAGEAVQIVYDDERLVPRCGGTSPAGGNGGGGFAWAISGYYLIDNTGPIQFSNTDGDGVIVPAVAGDLQIWFTCGNTDGNTGVDSDYGNNYHFTVGPAPADAGTASDALVPTGTVVVQVLGDSVSGNAGSIPPDTIVSSPLADVLVYNGLWEAGHPLGETDANGEFMATLALGVHQIGVMEMTTDESLFASDGNVVTVTTTPTMLVIHVVPNTVEIQTSYDVGYGNAIYVTGETSVLGNWQNAYKASYNPGSNTWTAPNNNIPAGAQFKLILAPWVDGDSIPVTMAGVQWQSGSNQTAPKGPFSMLDLTPSF